MKQVLVKTSAILDGERININYELFHPDPKGISWTATRYYWIEPVLKVALIPRFEEASGSKLQLYADSLTFRIAISSAE
jgi:hypothetical protein